MKPIPGAASEHIIRAICIDNEFRKEVSIGTMELEKASKRRPPPWPSWSLLLGFDVFISYRHGAASPYARALKTSLTAAGLVCFLDEEETVGGVVLSPAIRKALKRSRLLVVIAAEGILQSTWVGEEIEVFRKRGRPIVPIDIDNFLPGCAVEDSFAGHLKSLAWLTESREGFDRGTSAEAVVNGVLKSLSRTRVRSIGAGIAAAVFLSLSAISIFAVIQWRAAEAQTKLAEAATEEAKRQTSIALSQALVARATNLRESNVPVALLLSLEALRFDDSVAARSILLDVLLASPHYGALLRNQKVSTGNLAWAGNRPVAMARLPRPNEDGGCSRGELRLWEVETGFPFGQPIPQQDCAPSAVTADGQTLARAADCALSSEGSDRIETCQEGRIALFDVQTGLQTGSLDLPGWVERIAISPDGHQLAAQYCGSRMQPGAANTSCDIVVLGIPSGVRIGAVPYIKDQTMSLGPGGKVLAQSRRGADIILWSTQGKASRIGELTPWTSEPAGLAFSSDGTALAIGGPAYFVALWDVVRRELKGERFEGRRNEISSVAFSPDNRWIAAESQDGSVEMWDSATRRPTALIVPEDHLLARRLLGHGNASSSYVRAVAFGPDGTLASGADDRTIFLWDAAGRLRGRLMHTGAVESIAFSADGKILAGGTISGTVKLWDAITLAERGTMPQWDAAERQRSGRSFRNYVYAVRFSPDGRYLVAGDSLGNVLLWDVSTRKQLARLRHNQPVDDVVFTPDGSMLAFCTGATIVIWDVAGRTTAGELRAPPSGARSLAFNSDGAILAVGDRAGNIHLWDFRKRQALRAPLTGHAYDVMALAFEPSGARLMSGAADGIRLWDVTSWSAIGSPLAGSNPAVLSVAISTDGKRAASGHAYGTLRLWDIDLASWKTLACRMSNRNLTPNEWETYVRAVPYETVCPGLPLPAEITR